MLKEQYLGSDKLQMVINMITCPKCGEVSKENIFIFNEKIKKQNIKIIPILPTCKICNSEVSVSCVCDGINLIVLNGTCGSGKTTIAERLMEKGWLAIDGDCAIQSLRHKKGTKDYEWNELIDEILSEIDIASLFGNNVVISHILLEEDYSKYIDFFRSRNIKYRLFLFKPDYELVVQRCQARTCHTSITPEKWIKHFYDKLDFFDERHVVIDNSVISENQTIERILSMIIDHSS